MELETPAKTESQPLSSFQIVQKAFEDTNTHFKGLALGMSFSLLLTISAFVPMWVWYINAYGQTTMMVTLFQIMMVFALFIVVLFMSSLLLFNRTRAQKPLSFWRFTKDTSWPWTVEGLKATCIILAGLIVFVIPGIVKCVHYMFFHFVVFFNPDYKAGNITCLKHAKKLSQGLRWWILGLFIILPHFIGEIPNQMAKMVFVQTDSLFIIYPALMASLYVMGLAVTYLFSLMYFMYFLKEKELSLSLQTPQ